MAASREERMQQRMRGAGRHEVADDSFGFVLPVAEASPEIAPPGPAIRTEPNTSAKRRRLSPAEESEAPTPTPAPAPVPTSIEGGSSVSRSSARLSASKAQSSPAPPPPPQPQPEPPSTSSQVQSSASRISARPNPPRPDPYSISESAPSVADVLEPPQIQPAREQAEPEAEAEVEADDDDDDDELESLPAAVPVPGSHSSGISGPSSGLRIVEEVTESPVEAPGSGHRRRIRLSNAATQSTRLQRMVMEAENGITGEFTTSSPLARKTRMSAATTTTGLPSARSTRASAKIASSSSPVIQGVAGGDSSPSMRPPPPRKSNNGTMAATRGGSTRTTRNLQERQQSVLSTVLGEDEEADELSSPLAAGTSSARKPPQPKAQKKIQKKKKKVPLEKRPEPIEEEEEGEQEQERDLDVNGDDEQAEAEEIDVHEAARRIGRKRPRASPTREESPELNAEPADKAEPARKRRQKRPQESPAQQAQPKVVQKKKPPRKSTERRGGGGGGGGEAIPIIVQRYTKPVHMNEDDSDADILSADIPFANRGGVNVIDVLAQMCDEVIESNLETLHKATTQAADSATRKEYRTKLRALEAFQEELRTRLLEHTIALDTMHALKKRVRSVQKEKLALRSEILRIRAEREQVALRMDAVRIKHERESKESLHLLGLSSAMHDIELAADNGRSAPGLGPKEKKVAELANLELLVSRVADEASTTGGDGGGNLKQIKDFNAFLERAAAALEGR